MAILDVGGVNDCADEMALRIDNDVALAPLDLLARVIAAIALSVVLTLWLSMTPAVGLASRPFSRGAVTSMSLIEDQRPSSRQA